MTKIISFLNHKGGVGRTTSAVNIGTGLHLLGKRILLIDLDLQANMTLHLVRDAEMHEENIYGALRNVVYSISTKTVRAHRIT